MLGKIQRGSVDPKLVVGCVFAAVGLGWAAISVAGTMKGTTSATDSDMEQVEGAFDNEGNQIDADYTKAKSGGQIEQVANEIGVAVNSLAGPVLTGLSAGAGTPASISQAVNDAFIPILSGDHNSFVDAIRAMGGVVAEDLDDEHPIFTHLAKKFKHASVDLSRVRVEKYVPQERGMGMRMVEEDDEISGDEPRRNVSQRVMEMNPASVFPDAPDKTDPSAVEVQIPVQPKGEKNESVFGLILTWNADAQLWQPAAYKVTTVTVTEGDAP